MSAGQSTTIPELDTYERNRQQITAAELAPFENQWVAFSPDGTRIVAAAANLIDLDRRLIAMGENPEQVGLEFIAAEDCNLGSSGLRG